MVPGPTATIFVVVGVVIEGIAEWLPKDRKETRLLVEVTRTRWLILVIALVGEWVAQHSKDADDALIIAFLNDRTATANKRAEELRKANLELEKELNPRIINDKQADIFIKAIKPFAGTPFEVEADPAAEYGLVGRVITLLTKAGWQWKGYSSSATSLPPGNELVSKIQRATGGVSVRIRTGKTAELGGAAKALSFALTNVIGSVSLEYDPERPEPSPFLAPANAILIQIFRVR
jgi:hypothetical protein